MGLWLISTDTLADSRFVISPLAETTAALRALERGTPHHPGEQPWLATHLPAYRERLAADPLTAQTVKAAFGATWTADYLTRPPDPEGGQSFDQELAELRATPPAEARRHLTVSLGGPLPSALERDDLPERTADLLAWVWTHTVRPYWERRRRILEADIAARTAQLGRGGWSAALDGLRPGTRWLGDGRLRINAYEYPPRQLGDAQLLFVPVTMKSGWVAWRDDGSRYALVYTCSGVLAEAGRAHVPESLGALLGPARARILVLLDTPKSTTQLVALTGQALGSVGRHLKVLLDSGLAVRRRAGRSVLYLRSAAGEVLVSAAAGDTGAG
ncbi:winged helix-turn-helix transcriptional regulator [Streptomyces sp. TRM66268-LWL]|uniref:Winged helix-turn-helix transcriptional regulator n=1 Tax=Streptomyces polyasparticus TaxID=2767826 RepID=A0ABR7SHJ1_9ACTN|nr:winged helix-turn-helix domain-containing protein [Streptomyces polyasparticus]MBC9714991.1 winged helix-turn-helix transcriptional regulator [Streptomyces polyasparticus]